MIINNFESDFKALAQRSGHTQEEIANAMGIARPNLPRVFKGKVIPDKFVEACAVMGYDVKVVYVKR